MAGRNRQGNNYPQSFPHSGTRTNVKAHNVLSDGPAAVALSSEDMAGLNKNEQAELKAMMHQVNEMPCMQAIAQGTLIEEQRAQRQHEQAAYCPRGNCR